MSMKRIKAIHKLLVLQEPNDHKLEAIDTELPIQICRYKYRQGFKKNLKNQQFLKAPRHYKFILPSNFKNYSTKMAL